MNKSLPLPACLSACLGPVLACLALAATAQPLPNGSGNTPMDDAVARDARAFITQAAQAFNGSQALGAARLEVQVGGIDPRLTLAPCRRAEPYLPAGMKVLGRTRVGLRCVDGPSPWNITLPVTVSVFAPAVITRQALPAGTVLGPEHLGFGEVDWAAESGRPFADGQALLGRELARPLAAGAALLPHDIKLRQWFATGEMVQVLARGNGFSISTDGQAMSPGLEGQIVRVRTGNGRVVSGRATADRLVEVLL